MKIIILFFMFLYSCQLCPPTEQEKEAVEEVNKRGYAKIERIPCEYSYINCYILIEKIDTLEIQKIHQQFYSDEKEIWYRKMNVYDKKEKFLFFQFYDGSNYTIVNQPQTP